MSEIKDGGPAFPVTDMQSASPENLKEMAAMARGMSLRDHFAAKAMHMHGEMLSDMDIDGEEAWDEYVAKRAYKTADAMLRAREQ